MNNTYYEIDIKELFFFLLGKYKVILSSLLIGCLIGCCISFSSINDHTPENILKTLEKEKEKIDEEEVKQYANIVKLYNSRKEYENSSAIINLNANNVYKGTLSYGITSKENDVDEIIEYFKSTLDRDNGWEELCRYTDNEYSIKNLKELITIKNEKSGQDDKLTDSTYGFNPLNISIYGKTEQFVKKVVEFILDRFNKTKEEVSANYPSFSIRKNEEDITNGFDEDLLALQQEEFNTRQLIFNNLMTIKEKLSKEELLYYNYYYDYDNYFSTPKTGFSLKFPVLSGTGAVVVVIIVFAFIYVLKGTVNCENDIRKGYNIPLLGIVKTKNKPLTRIDRYIEKQIKKNDFDYINNIIDAMNNKAIVISNEYKEINQNLKNRAKLIGPLDKDANAINEIKKCDGIVLIVRILETKHNSIQRQIEIAKRFNKEILGFISLRD